MINETLQKNLDFLKFKDSDIYGTMVGYVEDVCYTAVEHPFGKVFLLTANYTSKRAVSQIEENVSVEAEIKDIAGAMVKMYEKLKSKY